jgi:hypothetical protein
MPSKTVVSRGSVAKGESIQYVITVQGAVPQSWCDRLGGLRVSVASRGRSTLEGTLADQAALFGVLDVLYQLGLPILEMKTLKRTKGVAG